VIQLLKEKQLYPKPSKCFFGVKEVEYLGHIVSHEGVKVDPMLAQGKTQGSMLQHRTNKTLTTGPFGNTCGAGEVSPKVEAGGVTGRRCL
jgi:hypothetical protein